MRPFESRHNSLSAAKLPFSEGDVLFVLFILSITTGSCSLFFVFQGAEANGNKQG